MRLVIVTGMSGAGKSVALHHLEDADYYCVDNLPLSLILPFIRIASDGRDVEYTKFAVGIDVRSGLRQADFERAAAEMKKGNIRYEVLFLDASDEALLKRYKETRRTHPLQARAGGSLEKAIALERQQLSFIREKADYIIDTSKLLTRELRTELIRIFVEDRNYRNLYITVQSFGFKYGIPADSDLVVDVRFLPNPYYEAALRPLTGNDPPIERYVMSHPESRVFIEKYVDLLNFLIPNYIREGKNQLVISVGCTGGRHRSVVMANAIAARLAGSHPEYGVRIDHRDVDKDGERKEGGHVIFGRGEERAGRDGSGREALPDC